jgi:hypothetical protein
VSVVECFPGVGFAGEVSVRMRMVVVLMGAHAVERSAFRTPSALGLVAIITGVLACGSRGLGKTSLGVVALVIVMLGIEVHKIGVFIVGLSWMKVLAVGVP